MKRKTNDIKSTYEYKTEFRKGLINVPIECPYCKNKNTEKAFKLLSRDNNTSFDFWKCFDCEEQFNTPKPTEEEIVRKNYKKIGLFPCGLPQLDWHYSCNERDFIDEMCFKLQTTGVCTDAEFHKCFKNS